MDLTDTEMSEKAVLFGPRKSLVGIVNVPRTDSDPRQRPGVILLNSGIIHRVGPSRLYVKLARRLAQSGATVLRFDLSGIGDSVGRIDNLPFNRSSIHETMDAMDYLADTCDLHRFLLIGICTGAVVSFDTALADERVVGAMLINAQGYLPENQAEAKAYITTGKNARYYFGNALHNPSSWFKLLSGRADYHSILRAMRRQLIGTTEPNTIRSPEVERVAEGLKKILARGAKLFLLYSEGDPGIDELNLILGNGLHSLQEHASFRYRTVTGSDHMFTPLTKQDQLMSIVGDWVAGISSQTVGGEA